MLPGPGFIQIDVITVVGGYHKDLGSWHAYSGTSSTSGGPSIMRGPHLRTRPEEWGASLPMYTCTLYNGDPWMVYVAPQNRLESL